MNSLKRGVNALRGQEFHTLETFIICFWTQQVSVTAETTFLAIDHILSGAILPATGVPSIGVARWYDYTPLAGLLRMVV